VVIFGAVLAIYIVRLFTLQVLSTNLDDKARENVRKRIVITPARGIIYDRNGRIYVTNNPIFELAVVPREFVGADTARLARYLNLPLEDLRNRLRVADSTSRLQSHVLVKQIPAEDFARIQEHLWEFPGLYTNVRNMRNYQDTVGSNVLGYINEVNDRDIANSQRYYDQGDLMGRSGLERNYEPLLRGVKGIRNVIKDVHGREVGAYAQGALDTMPVKGADIVISLDLDLQRYGEQLMQGKYGSIVALEPATGEVLAFVSAPSYDPRMLLTGPRFRDNYRKLESDSLLPLFNRPLMAEYPPGSIFKLVSGLAALQEGTLTPETFYGCAGGFMRNGGKPACHGHPSPLTFVNAVQHSCNAFFAGTYVDFVNNRKFSSPREGYSKWYEYVHSFGIGGKLGVDIPNERAGSLYTVERYNRSYRRQDWNGFWNLSNSIGQGEVLMTPLQMANMVAAIANRGHWYSPHFFRSILNGPDSVNIRFARNRVPIERQYFELVIEGMNLVVESGTGTGAQVPGIAICGKTGTAQNPHGEDHSVFVAFAPRENPRIAIAVLVENAGFGGVWGAPIAGLMIEKYLTGQVQNTAREQMVLQKSFPVPLYYTSAFRNRNRPPGTR
jgi:penicillin-binding protein 2